jgi:hypothetical protein
MGVSWGGDSRRAKSPSGARPDRHEPPADEVIDLREIVIELDVLDAVAPVEPVPTSFT